MAPSRLVLTTGAPGLLYFEDDVILHDAFHERCAALTIPHDWQLLYLGCLHRQPPSPAGPGLLRVTAAYDTHAVGIRASAYKAVLAALRTVPGEPGSQPPPDVLMASLHPALPTYAPWPNLVWQRHCQSTRTGFAYSNYDEHGRQRLWPEAVAALPDTAP